MALKRQVATTHSSWRTVNSSEQKKDDTTNSVRAGPRPIWSTENPQGDDILRKMSIEVSSTSTPEAQPMDKPASGEEKFVTLNRQDKASLTPGGDIQYHVNTWKKATVEDKISHGDMQDCTTTCREQVTGTAHIVASEA